MEHLQFTITLFFSFYITENPLHNIFNIVVFVSTHKAQQIPISKHAISDTEFISLINVCI